MPKTSPHDDQRRHKSALYITILHIILRFDSRDPASMFAVNHRQVYIRTMYCRDGQRQTSSLGRRVTRVFITTRNRQPLFSSKLLAVEISSVFNVSRYPRPFWKTACLCCRSRTLRESREIRVFNEKCKIQIIKRRYAEFVNADTLIVFNAMYD